MESFTKMMESPIFSSACMTLPSGPGSARPGIRRANVREEEVLRMAGERARQNSLSQRPVLVTIRVCSP